MRNRTAGSSSYTDVRRNQSHAGHSGRKHPGQFHASFLTSQLGANRFRAGFEKAFERKRRAVRIHRIAIPRSIGPRVGNGRVKPGELPAAKVARTVYSGPYEGLPSAWADFDKWIRANGHEQAEDLWEMYSVGPQSTPDPANCARN